ncbi:MAG: hypothetical protein M1594_00135 [Candidatus Marsarchaeota archaeon]|nr:hypothetical protein [Candidatus Marsarchaeota archaeon]
MDKSSQTVLILLLLLGALILFSKPTAGVAGQAITLFITLIFSVVQAAIAIAASSVFGLVFVLLIIYLLTAGNFDWNSAVWLLLFLFIAALVI